MTESSETVTLVAFANAGSAVAGMVTGIGLRSSMLLRKIKHAQKVSDPRDDIVPPLLKGRKQELDVVLIRWGSSDSAERYTKEREGQKANNYPDDELNHRASITGPMRALERSWV